MDRKIPLTFALFDSVYGNSFPEEQYYVILFDRLPSKHSTYDIFSKDLIDYFNKLGFVEHSRVRYQRDLGDKSDQRLFVNMINATMIATRGKFNKGEGLISFEIYYDVTNGDVFSQFDFDEIKNYQKESKRSSIQLVKSEMGHLDTEEYDLTVPECDLELNYGKDILPLHETIIKRLNTPHDKGIILFHGDPGTGKTTYIKLLTSLIKQKELLFIPPSMAEMLSEPSIIPFLMDHKNSILLIEDAEKVISERENKGSEAGVSNILNLTDGILGDCLNIQVIATFNMPKERIDKALLRKGRLICEHKFDKLSVDATNILLKHLGKDMISDKPLTLADIYNIDTDSNRISKERSRVGFQIR
jgi:energy-coupling factor transporter ATP-binding protein EcfA2